MDCNLLAAQALFNRGFFITYDNDVLSLSSRNHLNDFYKIKDLLEDLDLKHKWENNNFNITQPLNSKQYVEVSNYPARNHEVGFPEFQGTWKSFRQRKHSSKIPTLALDPGVAILVKAISSVGISTYSSCDGHGKKKPKIVFSSYHHAAWFEYLQSSYIGDLTLNYI